MPSICSAYSASFYVKPANEELKVTSPIEVFLLQNYFMDFLLLGCLYLTFLLVLTLK